MDGRTGWIIWCLAWALVWLFLGWLILPFINLVMAAFSVLAILLPVGRVAQETCAVCAGRYPAANMALHMSYRHGR